MEKKFREVLQLFPKPPDALGYGLVTLLTAGVERILSTVAFQCPCSATWNLPYGLVFLLVPALALFLLGLVLSARTWRLLTGCCARGAGEAAGKAAGEAAGAAAARGGAVRRGALVLAQLSAAAALAPLTWVAVALLGASFYECAASGSGAVARRVCRGGDPDCAAQLPLAPCRQAPAPVQGLLKELTAQSQILGWILIAAVIIFLLIFVSIIKCVSPVSFMQLRFWKIYLEQEQKILKSEATEHAAKLAKENVKCFFEGSQPKVINTPTKTDWQQISSLYTFNPKEQYYSMLHKKVSQSLTSSEGDAVVSVLGFVDSSDMNTTANL